MGIAFRLPLKQTSFLRGASQPPPPQVPSAFTWQAEAAAHTPPSGHALSEIVAGQKAGIVGLFGLDPKSAKDCQADIRRQCPDALFLDPSPSPLFTTDTLYDALASLCAGAKHFDLKSLLKPLVPNLIRWIPSITLVFDLTTESNIQKRSETCAAIERFLGSLDQESHRVFVLMHHRYRLDKEAKQAVPYLDLDRIQVWFRTELQWPDSHLSNDYLVHNRSETEDRHFHNQPVSSFRDLGFVHRATAYGKLQTLIQSDESQSQGGLYFVTGKAGAGKSRFLQDLPNAQGVNTGRALVCTVGFNRLKGDTDVKGLLTELVRLLLTGLGWDSPVQLPNDNDTWKKFLPMFMEAVGTWVTNGGACWRELDDTSHPALLRVPLERIVVGLDALDEADSEENLRKLFNQWLPEKLPGGIHLVCTTRPETAKKLNREPILQLDDPEYVDQDLRRFIDRYTGKLPSPAPDHILALAQGNFLVAALLLAYLLSPRTQAPRQVVEGLLEKRDRLGDVLGPVYDLYWDEFRKNEDLDFRYAAEILADLLSTAPAELPTALVFALAKNEGIKRPIMQKVIDRLTAASLMERDSEGQSQVYHDTFKQYLLRLRQPEDQQGRLHDTLTHAAAWCRDWEKQQEVTKAYAFALSHAVYYHFEAKNWSGLYDLLVGPPNVKAVEYLEARFQIHRDPGIFAERILTLLSNNPSAKIDTRYGILDQILHALIKESPNITLADRAVIISRIYPHLHSFQGMAKALVVQWAQETLAATQRTVTNAIPLLIRVNQVDGPSFPTARMRVSTSLRSVAFSNDSRLIACLDDSDLCTLIDVETLTQLLQINVALTSYRHGNYVPAKWVSFNGTNSFVVGGRASQNEWDRDIAIPCEYRYCSGTVRRAEKPSGEIFYVPDLPSSILQQCEKMPPIRGHSRSERSDYWVTWHDDTHVCVWDGAKNSMIGDMVCNDIIDDACLTVDGRRVAAVTKGGNLFLAHTSLMTRELAPVQDNSSEPVQYMNFASSGILWVNRKTNVFEKWEFPYKSAAKRWPFDAWALSRDGDTLVLHDMKRSDLIMIEFNHGTERRIHLGLPGQIVAAGPSARYVVFESGYLNYGVLDTNTLHEVGKLTVEEQTIEPFSDSDVAEHPFECIIHPVGKSVLVRSPSGRITLHQFPSGETIRHLGYLKHDYRQDTMNWFWQDDRIYLWDADKYDFGHHQETGHFLIDALTGKMLDETEMDSIAPSEPDVAFIAAEPQHQVTLSEEGKCVIFKDHWSYITAREEGKLRTDMEDKFNDYIIAKYEHFRPFVWITEHFTGRLIALADNVGEIHILRLVYPHDIQQS